MTSRSAATATAKRLKGSPAPLSILDTCLDPTIFGPWFKDRSSWGAWFCFLKTMFGLPLDETELALFVDCTGRNLPAPGGYTEASLVIGRRGGKSLVLALIAAFLSAFRDWSPFLVDGERGTIMVVAADRRQATVIFRYLKGMLSIRLLAGLIERETLDVLELSNGITIEIQTASYKTIRGRTVIAALCDELAFWSDESSANPDSEIIGALKPAMSTIPRAMLLKASSPYARRGVLWTDYRKHFGKDESSTLVWQAPTRTMNPSVPQSFIDAALDDDPAAAAAEYLAQFRTDVESFVSREAVDICTVSDRLELPPLPNVIYSAFVDPSGGSADSMTLAIAHKEGDCAVLDAIRERRPPFSPEDVVSEFSQLLKTFRVRAVVGDRYAGEWPRERFRIHQIEYQASAKPKSDLYRDLLPLLNGGRAELLDHPKLISQLCALERRTARSGRDSIDHPPGQHDDVANAVAGALNALIDFRPETRVEIFIGLGILRAGMGADDFSDENWDARFERGELKGSELVTYLTEKRKSSSTRI